LAPGEIAVLMQIGRQATWEMTTICNPAQFHVGLFQQRWQDCRYFQQPWQVFSGTLAMSHGSTFGINRRIGLNPTGRIGARV
jgi:hypothetical protein